MQYCSNRKEHGMVHHRIQHLMVQTLSVHDGLDGLDIAALVWSIGLHTIQTALACAARKIDRRWGVVWIPTGFDIPLEHQHISSTAIGPPSSRYQKNMEALYPSPLCTSERYSDGMWT